MSGHFNLLIQQVLVQPGMYSWFCTRCWGHEGDLDTVPCFPAVPSLLASLGPPLVPCFPRSLCCDRALCYVTICPRFSPALGPRLQVWSDSRASRISCSANCARVKATRELINVFGRQVPPRTHRSWRPPVPSCFVACAVLSLASPITSLCGAVGDKCSESNTCPCKTVLLR